MKAAVIKIASGKGSFRITARRSDKSFRYTSAQLNAMIGAHIVKKTGRRVKLKNPATEIFVELTGKGAFAYAKKIKGIGGMPVGSAGKAIALLSGGIDSPVSAFRAMKRGCRVILAHFYTEKPDKIIRLAERLSAFGRTGLYLVPFAGCQTEIIKKFPSELRMIAYRRMMLRI